MILCQVADLISVFRSPAVMSPIVRTITRGAARPRVRRGRAAIDVTAERKAYGGQHRGKRARARQGRS